jgi:hypothetical protein
MKYQTMTIATRTAQPVPARPSAPLCLASLKPTEWIVTPTSFDVRGANFHAHDGPGGLP